jgi:hypothetical protein
MQAIKYKRFYSSKRWKSSSLNGNCCGQSTFFNTYETRIEKKLKDPVLKEEHCQARSDTSHIDICGSGRASRSL